MYVYDNIYRGSLRNPLLHGTEKALLSIDVNIDAPTTYWPKYLKTSKSCVKVIYAAYWSRVHVSS